MLLCQHRICLRRTLPTVPTAKFRYVYLSLTHTRRPLIENTSVIVTCTDTAARRSQCGAIKQRKSLLERQSHISKHSKTLIQKSLFIRPVYFHINRLQRCSAFRKTFVWLNEKARTCIIAHSYMSALRSRSLVNTVIPFFVVFPCSRVPRSLPQQYRHNRRRKR